MSYDDISNEKEGDRMAQSWHSHRHSRNRCKNSSFIACVCTSPQTETNLATESGCTELNFRFDDDLCTKAMHPRNHSVELISLITALQTSSSPSTSSPAQRTLLKQVQGPLRHQLHPIILCYNALLSSTHVAGELELWYGSLQSCYRLITNICKL